MTNAEKTIESVTLWWLRKILEKKMKPSAQTEKEWLTNSLGKKIPLDFPEKETVPGFLSKIKGHVSDDDYQKIKNFGESLAQIMVIKYSGGYDDMTLAKHGNAVVGDLEKACIQSDFDSHFLPNNVLMSIDFKISVVKYMYAGQQGELDYVLAENVNS